MEDFYPYNDYEINFMEDLLADSGYDSFTDPDPDQETDQVKSDLRFLAAQIPLGRAASSVAVGASKEKMRESGAQERETIGKGAEEQRRLAEQTQEFRERDEARDRRQATQAYRY